MTLDKTDYLIIALINVILFLGLQLQLAYSQQFPIPSPQSNQSLSPLLGSNMTGESLVESFGSPQALMEQVIKEAQEPGALDKMIDECNLLDPNTDIEEGKEQLECQERIINESKESSP